MKYETIPIPVEAHQQQLVEAHVPLGNQSIATAHPGDWIVKWPDGRLEVFTNSDFLLKFRTPPPPYIGIRQPQPDPRDVAPYTSGPRVTFADFPANTCPKCGASKGNGHAEDCVDRK